MIKAYNLETKELLGKYKTQQEVADDFDLTIEAVKGYFYRYKVYGDAKILNHKTGVWCYLVRENDIKKPNYKERCLNAIEYIKKLKNFKIKCVVLEEKELYASENDFVKELLEILGADDENIKSN